MRIISLTKIICLLGGLVVAPLQADPTYTFNLTTNATVGEIVQESFTIHPDSGLYISGVLGTVDFGLGAGPLQFGGGPDVSNPFVLTDTPVGFSVSFPTFGDYTMVISINGVSETPLQYAPSWIVPGADGSVTFQVHVDDPAGVPETPQTVVLLGGALLGLAALRRRFVK